MTEHAYSTVFLVMSPETWASFDDETKETFKRVMAECSIEEREISRKMDSEAVAELEKQGMTVTYPDKQQCLSEWGKGISGKTGRTEKTSWKIKQ